ncbi:MULTISPECIES: hypothetical protein [Gordonia]|uniref:Uncharacterized protein n=1 Tax=Gordonia amicalis TaxID=89053 RepID=A0AAE4R7Q4_9ACTN|nr:MULTISPECIES: hypothetical protein [Gordonia]KAF0967562.1 hypothetical protein BPODLACK_03923 [Gordonia sp. YY1]MCR8898726.1 hypothetical protein [Gordonia sp. GONU]MCZ0914984.1 hypothetical protein [Gordonia amicalis]MCZ4579077.1 hypothetical protein [Gordonia amicalis]MCZ4652620.1 hypothetical protein [Gordonia amicalis]
MTDTVFDAALGPASASAEVSVHPAVLDDVRATLRQRGLDAPEVVLLGLDGNGCVSVGRFDTSRGAVADTYSDVALSVGALDRAIADHLIKIGRVESPTSPEWHDELFDLIARGRERLQDSDGTFLMGRRHIRLFRLARRDVEEAGGALIARGEELARAAVAGAQAPAVVITDGLSVWPGLRDGIAKAVQVPVVDAAPSPLTATVPAVPLSGPREAHTPDAAADAPDAEAATSADPDNDGTAPAADADHSADSDNSAAADHSVDTDNSAAAHTSYSTDNTSTEPDAVAAESAEESQAARAGADPDKESGVAVEVEDVVDATVELDAESVVDTTPNLVADEVTEPAIGSPGRSGDFPVVDVDRISSEQPSRPVDPAPATAFGATATSVFGTPPAQDPAPVREHVNMPTAFEYAARRIDPGPQAVGTAPMIPADRTFPAPEQHSPYGRPAPVPSRSRRTVLAGLALVCALAITAVAVALATGNDDSSQAPVAAPTTTTPTTTAPTTAAPTGQEYADPAIVAEARQPAQRYTPPPPPVVTNEQGPAPRPRSRAPRPQRGVTIPNPIPGLPPIVLP